MLKNLVDIFSGKNVRFAKFVSPIVERMVARLEGLQAGSLLHSYTRANLAASVALINTLLVDRDWPSEFQEQSSSIGQREGGNLFKVITARFLVAFLHNEENVATVTLNFGPPNKFIHEILKLHDIDSYEVETMFQDLWNSYEEEASRFTFRFYRHCLRAIGLSFDKEIDPFRPGTLLKLSSHCYTDILITLLGGRESPE